MASEDTAPLVACPECKSADGLSEQSIRYTFQPVRGLRADGDANDYSSFDYSDDVIVTGYSCDCGWFDSCELSPDELERIGEHANALLARMPRTIELEDE
jgi:hypothetical protein